MEKDVAFWLHPFFYLCKSEVNKTFPFWKL